MRKVLAFILMIFVISLCGCDTNNETNIIYLDEAFSIIPYIKLETSHSFYLKNKDKIYEETSSILNDLDNKFNVHKEDSLISQINSNSGKEYIECDDEFLKVLNKAIEISDNVSNMYDITIYSVWEKWDFINNYYISNNYHNPPRQELLDELLPLVNYKAIDVDGNMVKLEKKGAKIELGSIVKGYGADKIAKYLKDCGVNNAIINIGGNIICMGYPLVKKAWNIAISTPFNEGTDKDDYYVGTYKTDDDFCTVVTSGTYERYIKDENNVMYHHILSPIDGYPINNEIDSISVIGNIESMDADALSTALFGLGLDKALEYVNDKEYGLVIVTKDKKVYVTNQIKNNFVFNEVLIKQGYEVIYESK